MWLTQAIQTLLVSLPGLSWSSKTTSLPWPADLNHCTFQDQQ